MTDIYTKTHRRRVHVIEGDAAGIVARGTEIESLGQQMKGAAGVLEAIADGATEEKGRSIEKIREQVGEAYEELHLAGTRYEPTGTAMKAYGDALSAVQLRLRPLVTEIETQYADLQAKQQAATEAAQAATSTQDFDPTDTQAADAHGRAETRQQETATSAQTAEGQLDDLFEQFETQWDTWDVAYDAALGAVNDATTGNVSDDWTDNLAGVVEVIVEIVTVVGIVVAIAAIVIGGPILALVATVLAVVVLIGTAYLWLKGRKTGEDMIWAVVGVLPFGRLGKLFQAGQRSQAVKFLGGPVFDIVDSVGSIRSLRGIRTAVDAMGSGHGLGQAARAGLASRVADTFSGLRWGNGGFGNALTNIRTGGNAWAMNLADEFASYSTHHRNVVDAVADSNVLQRIVAGGNDVPNMGEIVTNVGDFIVKTTATGRDVVDVAGSATDGVQSLFNASPTDSWREQLNR